MNLEIMSNFQTDLQTILQTNHLNTDNRENADDDKLFGPNSEELFKLLFV